MSRPLQHFHTELRAMHSRSGAMSLRDLARRMTHRSGAHPSQGRAGRSYVTSPSTLSRVLCGKSFPKWSLAESLLLALDVHPMEVESTWKARWLQAREDRLGRWTGEAASSDEPPGAPAHLRTCETCGALIGNLDRHLAWHWRLQQQLDVAAGRSTRSTADPQVPSRLRPVPDPLTG